MNPNLNGLLTGEGIDPKHVIVLRHRPWEPRLKKALPWLAATRPDLFNAYQQHQGEKLEKAMAHGEAKYIASFIGHEPREAIFVGMYAIEASRSITKQEFWGMEVNLELRACLEIENAATLTLTLYF
jgi:hypothetical protein